jgi:hypothetical protein
MKTKRLSIHLVIIILVLAVSACSVGAPAPTSTPAPTNTPLPPTATATSTPPPTATPKPTKTPNLAATKIVEDAMVHIQSYVDNGYLPDQNGSLYSLEDYSREMAQINYLDVGFAGIKDLIKNFAVWGHVKLESAKLVNYPDFSGCGFSFRFNPDNSDGYTAYVTNEMVLLTYCRLHRCGQIGKTTGSGKLSLSNPDEVDMELIVYDTKAVVLVDGEFIGGYTLFSDKMLDPGLLLYSIVSGTNRDYGTRCQITDAHLWVAK